MSPIDTCCVKYSSSYWVELPGRQSVLLATTSVSNCTSDYYFLTLWPAPCFSSLASFFCGTSLPASTFENIIAMPTFFLMDDAIGEPSSLEGTVSLGGVCCETCSCAAKISICLDGGDACPFLFGDPWISAEIIACRFIALVVCGLRYGLFPGYLMHSSLLGVISLGVSAAPALVTLTSTLFMSMTSS